jgi:hypothetical protein
MAELLEDVIGAHALRKPSQDAHVCAQYGHIITNYALILAITLVVWPKCHETSNMIGYFVKDFLW